ncbi:hypothetical protein F5884DRAFT_750835 [Xylogone sp. PMI_703]|nr:hypothetical protein F5884DRAFT_750835 [Xylogone sp. PMI_703]
MYSNLLSHSLAILLAVNIQEVASVCTSYRKISNNLDSVSQKSSSQFDAFYEDANCPGQLPCNFLRGPFGLTVPRFLNISTSSNDTDAIFDLVGRSYTEFNEQTQQAAWVTFDGTKDTTNETQYPDSLLVAPANTNTSLLFQPYMKTSIGQLSDCSDSSLEGAFIFAAAPWIKGQKIVNSTASTADGDIQGQFTTNSTDLGPIPSQTAAPSPTSTHHGGDAARPTATLLPFGVALLGMAALL